MKEENLDVDVAQMDFKKRGEEIMRLRGYIRWHKGLDRGERCWHCDLLLYDATIPEGSESTGRMWGDEELLLKDCAAYVRGQQCFLRQCPRAVTK